MSDSWQGPGWWKAQDGKWYPPELHPTGSPLHGKPTSGTSTAVTVLAAIGLVALVLLGGCAVSLFAFSARSGEVFDQFDVGPVGPGGDRNGPVLVDLGGCDEGDAPFSLRASGEVRHSEDPFAAGQELADVVDVEFTVEFYDASGGRLASAPVVVEGLRRGDTATWMVTADGEFDDRMSCNVTDVRWVD